MSKRKFIKPKGFTKGHVAKANNSHLGLSHWLFHTALKLSIIFVVTFALYSIYLDGKVRRTFEGQRWEIPAQIYSKVRVLTPNQAIKYPRIEYELEQVGYQRVKRVEQPGEFSRNNNRLTVYRRPFDFGYGLEPATKLLIEQRGGDVYRLWQDDEEVSSVKLEPLLIDRILSPQGEDRVYVSLEMLPDRLIDTLLLVEDKDFYNHHGVSPTGILRAFWHNLLAGKRVQGGSTLTQQLAKNMYLNSEKTIWRKVNEALMSIIMEIRYSKDQLLEAYINQVYLGQHFANGIYGFGLGSQFYFGKSISQLNAAEVALLVAQVKGPSYYDPWRNQERAVQRRDLVLRLMYQDEIISQAEYELALSTPLSIRTSRRMDKHSFPAYMQLVRRELHKIGASKVLQSGIKVFTAFDLHKQLDAEQSVKERLSTLEKNRTDVDDLEVAMVISEVRTGAINAVIGGREVKYSGFNRALDAKRPIGSLIKPVVYLTALERYEQYNLATPLVDKPITLQNNNGKTWKPKNYDGKYRDSVPLIEGLVKSLNVPTVNLGMELGTQKVAQTLQALGYSGEVELLPSMLLGTTNMSAFEVNQWFNTIANAGVYHAPSAIQLVSSADGDILWQRYKAVDGRLSSQGAFLIEYALRQVTKTGTAQSLSWQFPDLILAGKTGTSNDLRDSWFVGYDLDTVVTTWIGRDDNKPMGLTGSSGALSLYSNFLQKYGGFNRSDYVPEGIEYTTFELTTGNAVQDNCADVAKYPAISDGISYASDCLLIETEAPSWLEQLFGMGSD
ncbi:penicillin-binding protein 1B [Thalassotalea aquiviva]|uniref:penicillin-binding protein 1B n=1 Tax=Thalassotalea aquiviva TaxID=3242415 RepID=UPI00352BCF47